jgi:hypothetical protein
MWTDLRTERRATVELPIDIAIVGSESGGRFVFDPMAARHFQLLKLRWRAGRTELTRDCQAFRGVLGTKVVVLKPREH